LLARQGLDPTRVLPPALAAWFPSFADALEEG